MPIADAVKTCFRKYGEFEGRASRAEYWWFLLAVLLAGAAASVISYRLYALVSLITFLPLVAVGARRLHETNRSGWWQLLALVPLGVIVVVVLLALPAEDQKLQFWDRPVSSGDQGPGRPA